MVLPWTIRSRSCPPMASKRSLVGSSSGPLGSLVKGSCQRKSRVVARVYIEENYRTPANPQSYSFGFTLGIGSGAELTDIDGNSARASTLES